MTRCLNLKNCSRNPSLSATISWDPTSGNLSPSYMQLTRYSSKQFASQASDQELENPHFLSNRHSKNQRWAQQSKGSQ